MQYLELLRGGINGTAILSNACPTYSVACMQLTRALQQGRANPAVGTAHSWILVASVGSLSEPRVDGNIFSVHSVTASCEQVTTRSAHSKEGNENLFSD